MSEQSPLVTIGIPTYRRSDLLERALICATSQSYRRLKIIVSDNGTPGDDNLKLVERYRASFHGLEYVKHPTNIGPRANFFGLLERADTPYFMWLADDDEISHNFVEKLVELLETDPRAVTVAGNWFWMREAGTGALVRPREYASSSRWRRLARYIWRADDAFFYGLHRTDVLRQASFHGYSWPNREEVMNWAYVYLLDLVLRGHILIHPDTSVRFINHDYTTKTYISAENRFKAIARFASRRLNVHVLYLAKTAQVAGILVAVSLLPISLLSLTREVARSARDRVQGWLRRLRRPSPHAE